MTGTRTRIFALLAAVALALPLVACGDDGPTGPNFQNPSTIRITNEVGGPVLFIFFRPCGTTAWGEDQLAIRARQLGKNPNDPIESVIQPTESKDFTVEAGCYDLRADHLETPEPGQLIIKTRENQTASPVSILTWTITEAPIPPI